MDKKTIGLCVLAVLVVAIGFAYFAFPQERVVEVPGEPVVHEVIKNRTILINDPAQQQEIDRLREELDLERSKEPEEEEEDLIAAPVDREVIDNLFLGDFVSFTVDDGDLQKLFDGEVRFDEEDYDAHEEIRMLLGTAHIAYSSIDDEELEERVALSLDNKGSIEYAFVFDDSIEMGLVSDDEPLEITFLGRDFDIVKIDGNSLTFRSGSEFYVREGESIDFDGHEVTLSFVSENDKVSVCVDGKCHSVEEFDTEQINGVDVRAEDILFNNRGGSATLVLGEDTIITQKDGDEYLDDDESPWDFMIVENGGFLEELKVSYDETREDPDDSQYPPLYEGDFVFFPSDFASIGIGNILEDEYFKYSVSFDEFHDELYNDTDVDNEECVSIQSSDDEGIEVEGEETDIVYVCSDGKAYYEDSTGDWYETLVTNVELVNDNTRVPLDIGGAGRLRFENPSDLLVRLDTDWGNQRLGLEEDEAEANDVLFGADGVGEREESILTPYGSVLYKPESKSDKDEFELWLPTDRVEVEVFVQ